jgi:hypothetical protein
MLRRVLTASVLPALVTLAMLSGTLVAYGVPAVGLAKYLLYLAVLVSFPGVLTWRTLVDPTRTGRHRPTWFEDLALGTILGFTLQLPFFLTGVAWQVLPYALLGPPLLALLFTATPRGRAVLRRPTERLHPAAAWAMTLPIIYGTSWLVQNTFPRRPLWLPKYKSPNVDEVFHEALIAEVGSRFPAEIPFLLGVRLDYHWFVHAQVAAARSVTGLTSVEMLRFAMPATVLTLGLLGLGAVALRLTRRPSLAWMAPALLVLGAYHLMGPEFHTGTFYEPYLTPRFVNSPSQSYGVMMSMPAVALILEVLRPQRRTTLGIWVALTLSLVGLSGAKATFMPVFVCGAIAAWGVHLLRHRRVDRELTGLAALLLAVFGGAQVVLFGGEGGAMQVWWLKTVEVALLKQELQPTTGNLWLMSGVILVGWLGYGVGVVGLRRGLLEPRVVWLVVSVAAGITVPFVLYRAGLSQLWFSRTAAELVALTSVWGLSVLLPRPAPVRKGVALVVSAVLTGTAAFGGSWLVAELTGSTKEATVTSLVVTLVAPVVLVALLLLLRLAGGRSAGFPRIPASLVVSVVLGLGLSSVLTQGYLLATDRDPNGPDFPDGGHPLFRKGGFQAARHIARSSGVHDIVATNAHCKRPRSRLCDNRHFWIAAYTERRVLIEGWGYNAVTNEGYIEGFPNSRIPVPYPGRLTLNDRMFTAPSEEVLHALVDDYSVDWLFVARAYDADVPALDSFARRTKLLSRTFGNPRYVVYKVIPGGS